MFPLARGIVTEVGGWLSHAAIQAREYDLTGIVGAVGVMDALRTGELVRLGADGTIERFLERRTEDRAPVSVRVNLRREGQTLPGRFGDLSCGGALLLVSGHKLDVGEKVEITCAETADALGATIVRNGTVGVYGLRFRPSIDRALAKDLGARPGDAVYAA